MFIPTWLLMLDVSLLTVLSIAAYLLIGFILVLVLEDSDRFLKFLLDKCNNIKKNPHLSYLEKKIISQAIKTFSIFKYENYLIIKWKSGGLANDLINVIIISALWPIVLFYIRIIYNICRKNRNI